MRKAPNRPKVLCWSHIQICDRHRLVGRCQTCTCHIIPHAALYCHHFRSCNVIDHVTTRVRDQ